AEPLASVDSAWPGPDGYLYVGASCDFNWIDISGTGTEITGMTDNGYRGPFDFGFTFPHYTSTYTQFYVATNGFITLGTGNGSPANQCPLPTLGTPNNLIALLWDDLYPNTDTGGAYYQSF